MMEGFITAIVIIFLLVVGMFIGYGINEYNIDLNKTSIIGSYQLDSGDCQYTLKDYTVKVIDKCGHQVGDKLKIVDKE